MSAQSKRKKYPGDTPSSDFASATPFDDGRMVDVRYAGGMTPDGFAMADDRYQAVGVRFPYSPCHSTTMSNDSDSGASSDEDDGINLADFDEHEAEVKRHEFSDDMYELEQHFANAREILLGEKLAALDENLQSLNEDRLPEYVQAFERYERDMQIQLDNAETWKEMHIQSLKFNVDCEKTVIDLNLSDERDMLLSTMRDELTAQIAAIETEREVLKAKRAKLCDPTIGDLVRATLEAQTLMEGKKISGILKRAKSASEKVSELKTIAAATKVARRRTKSPPTEDISNAASPMRHRLRQTISAKEDFLHPASRSKPTIVSGPFIVYLLREQDIMDDWVEIGHSLRQLDQKQAPLMNGHGGNQGPVNISSSASSGKRVPVRIASDGKLYYDHLCFAVGDDVAVIRPSSKVSERTQLWKLSPGEVVLRNPGTAQQSKIPIAALSSGRWLLKRAEQSVL